VTPIIVRGLGAELYGAWVMIRQTIGYLSLSDLRPTGTLKFTLGVTQHVENSQQKQRQVGCAVQLWAITFPIFLIIGIGCVWAVPFFIHTSTEYIQPIRIAMSLLILSVALNRLLSLPANVLRGVNLEYKAMGLNAAVVVLGGILSALAIWYDYGLPGLAAATIVGVVISSGVRFWIALKTVSWFGIARPSREELIKFFKLSAWLFLSALSWLLISSGDIILVGITLGPTAAAIYVTTGMVLRIAIDPIAQLLSSASPGLVGLCGKGDWERMTKVRTEMHVIAILIMTVIGVGVICLNESFLNLWLGPNYYGGDIINMLLVILAIQMLLLRTDAVIVDGMLEFRLKALATLVSGGMGLVVGGLMAFSWGMSGVAAGMIMGRLGLLAYLSWLIRQRTGMDMKVYILTMLRIIATMCLLLIGAYFLSPFISSQTWLSFLILAVAAGCLATGIVLWIGLCSNTQKMLITRFGSLIQPYTKKLMIKSL
jgi:O-antigen/teichoic acid export membrane protein